MLFNSLSFAIFFPLVFVLYWFIFSKSLKKQNLLLIIASYFFYAYWDWRLLFLLVFSTLLDYLSGKIIFKSSTDKNRKICLFISIFVNLGFLCTFKYFNFFIDSFKDLISIFGLKPNIPALSIILPVGISFYTFHGISYVLDIYNNKIKPCNNFINYSLFVSFFPLLVAGPIERATHLLPQIERRRFFNYGTVIDGMRQILWGLFKKMVIADNCAYFVNLIFNNATYSGSTLIIGAFLFAFQIYCDFSGYSDIALGVARLMGIELLQNFKYPYFSRSIAEFWRRWHISLSSWFKDYVYIPLGGSKCGLLKQIRNTFIIFGLSGFWHGANWTFIIWGLLHAIYMIPSIIFKKNRNNIDIVAVNKNFPNIKELAQILVTFSLTTFAWIFFRAESLIYAISYIKRLFSGLLNIESYVETINFFYTNSPLCILMFLIVFFIIIEWTGRTNKYAIEKLGINWVWPIRVAYYYALVFITILFAGSEQQFIYFQF